MAMTLSAGRLRHRVTIQTLVSEQDTAGDLIESWHDVAANIAAGIEPLGAREFVAASATQSTVTTKIIIRYRPGIAAKMRVVHNPIGGELTYYNIAKPIRDPYTGLEWLTLLASDGANDG